MFIDSTKLKSVWIKLQHFSNDAFQSYFDLFQGNWISTNLVIFI